MQFLFSLSLLGIWHLPDNHKSRQPGLFSVSMHLHTFDLDLILGPLVPIEISLNVPAYNRILDTNFSSSVGLWIHILPFSTSAHSQHHMKMLFLVFYGKTRLACTELSLMQHLWDELNTEPGLFSQNWCWTSFMLLWLNLGKCLQPDSINKAGSLRLAECRLSSHMISDQHFGYTWVSLFWEFLLFWP